jgi:hypothetical protein
MHPSREMRTITLISAIEMPRSRRFITPSPQDGRRPPAQVADQLKLLGRDEKST